MHQFAKLLVLLPGGASSNREDGMHIRIEQAFAQDALADHAGCAEENGVHMFITFSCGANRRPRAL